VGAPGHLKPKDLVGIPWRVALALQADGWWLRRDIIWSKPNPMPESVTDRPTTSHEYVFLLTKAARYFFDRDAVREPAVSDNAHDLTGPGYAAPGQSPQNGNRQRKVPRGWDTGPGDHKDRRGRYVPSDAYEPPEMRPGRNLRSVWSIPTQPFAGAHFATMPQAIVERCIKAGCPEGGTVLDPFAGSGTTLYVARKLGRNAGGFELNEEYRPLIKARLAQGVLL
jgi:site-specific DNA-methyltransferase (cytosine-N4-specific)